MNRHPSDCRCCTLPAPTGTPEPEPIVLTAADRKLLAFALDLAFDHMVSEDGFTDADHAALDKLRRIADGKPQP